MPDPLAIRDLQGGHLRQRFLREHRCHDERKALRRDRHTHWPRIGQWGQEHALGVGADAHEDRIPSRLVTQHSRAWSDGGLLGVIDHVDHDGGVCSDRDA